MKTVKAFLKQKLAPKLTLRVIFSREKITGQPISIFIKVIFKSGLFEILAGITKFSLGYHLEFLKKMGFRTYFNNFEDTGGYWNTTGDGLEPGYTYEYTVELDGVLKKTENYCTSKIRSFTLSQSDKCMKLYLTYF